METTPAFTSRSKSVLVFSFVSLLVKGGECGELVLPSLPPLVQMTEEREELVCGRVGALTGNRENKGRQYSSAGAVPVASEGGKEQAGGKGRAWQHSLLFKVEDSVCAEPHLEVDTEEEPYEGIEETGQT